MKFHADKKSEQKENNELIQTLHARVAHLESELADAKALLARGEPEPQLVPRLIPHPGNWVNPAPHAAAPMSPGKTYEVTVGYGGFEPAAAEKAREQYQESDVLQFIGWLSGDIKELRSVEVPVLVESWRSFKATMEMMYAD